MQTENIAIKESENGKVIACYQNNIIINILNYAYDRINGIEGYSVSARALAIFSGLGFKDDSIINCHVVCSFQLFIFLEDHLEKSGKTIVMIYDKKLHLFAGNCDIYKMTLQSQETSLIRNITTQTKKGEHIQSFFDRFGAKATKAKQTQSRLKMLLFRCLPHFHRLLRSSIEKHFL